MRYGRKANYSSTTPTTPRRRVDDVKMKRRDSNSSRRKVVAMSRKDKVDTRSKMKDIKTFFMRLTKDPKLGDECNAVKENSHDDDGGMMMTTNTIYSW